MESGRSIVFLSKRTTGTGLDSRPDRTRVFECFFLFSKTPALALSLQLKYLLLSLQTTPPSPSNRSCASELNALFSAHAHAFPSIVVRSRTTYTRAETAAVAARVATTATSGAAAAAAAGAAAAGEEKQQQKANQHLALAAHVLSVAFAPFPTAALSLYEIEAPGWLGGWASRWCAAAAAPAPATPRNSPAASSSSSLSSYDSDENNSSNNSSNSAAVIVKLMALHGYAEGQPACGQGARLGEPQGGCGGGAGGGKPARTVFLPIW